MSTVVKDLGAVSAYAYAVEKGYTGTEAEFAELMADYAEVGQRAEDAAESALNSKTAAQTAATTATNKASEATTAATTATTKAGEASTSASTATSAKDTAVSASQTATTKATEATTAAATATSAATTATTAKDDAVSAKTAAQTAQTGAETAAASVEASAAQITTNAEDITQLKEDLENIGYNKVSIVSWDSSFFVTSSGAKGTASGFGNSGPIAVKKGEHIKAYVKGLSTNVALLSFATTETPTTFTPVIVSENSNAVWIDYKFINDGYAFVSSNINSVSPVVYKYININDVHSEIIKIENNIVTINHIYVAADGNDETGDGSEDNPYATIYHANETITDNDEKNRYIIHVGDGTYTDLQTKYSGIGYTDPATYQGIICKNYVEYIGNIKNPSECVISWDGATGLTNPSYHDVILKCPFHIRGGGIHGVGIHTRVSGFKIVGKNLRYAMHIDTGGQGDNVVWEVSDCIFNWFGVPDVSDYSSNANVACIGTGSSNFEKGHLLRVAIMNETGLTIGYQNHDNIRNSYYNDAPAFFEGAEITIEACNFSAGDQKTSIQMRNIYSGDVTQGYDRINIIDCIGIASLELSALSGVTLKWKAKIECSDIDTQIGVNAHFN